MERRQANYDNYGCDIFKRANEDPPDISSSDKAEEIMSDFCEWTESEAMPDLLIYPKNCNKFQVSETKHPNDTVSGSSASIYKTTDAIKLDAGGRDPRGTPLQFCHYMQVNQSRRWT